MYFEKDAASNTWKVYDGLDDPTASPPKVATLLTTLVFDASGKITSGSPVTAQIKSSNPNAPTPGTINGTAGVTLDFSNVSQFGSKFAVSSLKQDGYTAGALTGINVGNDGSIVATYSNGVTRTEGQLALAAFVVGHPARAFAAHGDVVLLHVPDDGGDGLLGPVHAHRSACLQLCH